MYHVSLADLHFVPLATIKFASWGYTPHDWPVASVIYSPHDFGTPQEGNKSGHLAFGV